ncbi:protein NLRC3-like isoform X2 [Dermacentor albipictus]|uniref:protein NLRC3-like isoform X2 n=1 Tax=Dermacentor albipictus TaxID=60249 RepID=UPI0038FC3812
MAPQSKKDAGVSIITPGYMALLQRMCTTTKATVEDVIAAFKLLRSFLDTRNPDRYSALSSSLSTSSCRAKKRSVKSAARTTAVCDDVLGATPGDVCSGMGFERCCTWEPNLKRCWIVPDLHLWNNILSRVCVELHEHKWGELTLQGYEWPENKEIFYDVVCASLLIHVLLRQHRCVTCVFLDMSAMTVERDIVWHALMTGAQGVKWLEYRPYFADLQSRADDNDAGAFLDCLAFNRTLKVLCVQESFLVARKGQALAEVVRDHVALEKLEVRGSFICTPSALLAAVVQSKTLTSLAVHACWIRTKDIEAMASALTLPAPSPACDGEGVTDVPPSPTNTSLKELNFINCVPYDSRLQQAYADLIGGVLVHLRLSKCRLGEAFAVAAATNLLFDRRLRHLNVADNDFSVGAVYNMIQALEVNKTLEALVVNLTGTQPQDELSCMFDLVREIDVFSHLKFNWIHPRGSDFANGVRASQAPTIWRSVDECEVEDAEEFLEALVSTRNVGLALLECTNPAKERVVQKLTNALTRIKSLRHLILRIDLPDPEVTNLFRSLEGNRSIALIEFRCVTFRQRTAKALGRLLKYNRTLTSLNVNLQESDIKVDRMVQLRLILGQLKEALSGNVFITSITVNVENRNHANDPIIKELLRSNSVTLNNAVHFVNGSKEKEDAIAFEALQRCYSVKSSLCTAFNNSDKSATEKIAEARNRLAFDYFVLVGVVKTRIVCNRRRKRKTTFDKLGRDLQARICSYLSLTDVVCI